MNAVKERIKAILRTHTAIQTVTDGTTREINLYPAFVVFSGDATHEKVSPDVKRVLRTYRILGLIKPMEEGSELAAEAALETWLDAIPALFDPRPGLWLNDNTDSLEHVQSASLLSDTGFIVLTLAGAMHAGCEWTLQVETIESLTQGA